MLTDVRSAQKSPGLPIAAGVSWLLAAAATFNRSLDADDGWRAAYLLFNLAVAMATVLTVLAVTVRIPERRSALWMAGLVPSLLGIASATVVSWAVPLWMGLLAIGFGLQAIGARSCRGPLLALAAAQAVGIAVLLAASELGLGPPDDYGDHPYAASAAVTVTALATCAALAWFTRMTSTPPS